MWFAREASSAIIACPAVALIRLGCLARPGYEANTVPTVNSICLLHWTTNLQASVTESLKPAHIADVGWLAPQCGLACKTRLYCEQLYVTARMLIGLKRALN